MDSTFQYSEPARGPRRRQRKQDLAALFPTVAAQWHPRLNPTVTIHPRCQLGRAFSCGGGAHVGTSGRSRYRIRA